MNNQEFLKSITLDGEEWRIIDLTNGYYAISSFGRIASLSHYVEGGNNAKYYTKQRLLTASISPNGYVRVRFCTNTGVNTTKLVHRLVAEAFIPNPNSYPFIDHIDGDRTNNKANNLRWCTRSMNMMNPITRLRNSNARKGKPVVSCRPVVQLKDGKMIATYPSLKDSAIKCNFKSFGNIADSCRNPKHNYMGYRWMYLSDYESLINKSKNSQSTDVD